MYIHRGLLVITAMTDITFSVKAVIAMIFFKLLT